MKSTTYSWLLGVVILGSLTETGLGITITRTSDSVLYIDTSANLWCSYASYSISNNDAVSYSNLWVKVDSFSGTNLRLGGGDPGQFNLGNLGVNGTNAVFFYLRATNVSAVAETHSVKVYRGRPDVGTLLTNQTFSLTVSSSLQNNSTKINGVSSQPSLPTLGGLVLVTINGETGQIGGPNKVNFTPAVYTNWEAGTFQLASCSIDVTNGNVGSFSNTVFVAFTNSANTLYTAKYWFRAANTTGNSNMVSPLTFVSGQNNYSHAIAPNAGVIPPILPPTNMTVLANLASVSQLYTNETATFTVRITDGSTTNAISLDSVVDTLPPGFTYVSNSSQFNGVSIANPIVVGQALTWSERYDVPAGSSRDLTFQAIPTVAGYATNSAVAFSQSTLIDTTLATTDNVPAISVVRVLLAPTATNDTGATPEDAPLTVSAPGVLGNDSEPNGFTLSVVSFTQPAHGSVSMNANGSYSYSPNANYNGADSFTYTATNGNARASTGTVSLTVSALNDPPTLNDLTNVSILENAGQQVLNLSGISAGPADESGQSLSITAFSGNPGLIPNPTVSYVSPNTTGTLQFAPAPNSSGVSIISVVVTDNGASGSGSVNSVTNTFAVTVGAVNHPPTVDPFDPVTINEDAGQQAVSLTGISAGSPNETAQVLTVTASSSNPALIPNPTVNYTSPNTTGTLQFTPAANSNGVATITVIVSDDGGTANGGVNAVTNTFTVTVNSVNDPPTLNALSNLSLNEDSGPHTVNLTGISAGPNNETGQALTVTAFSDNPSLVPDPSVTYTSPNSSGSLQFTSAPGSNGVATIRVVVTDDGSPANGGVNAVTNTFTITVNAVNDPPTLDPLADREIEEDAGEQTVNLTGISAGPSDESSQTVTLTATSSNPGLIPNPSIDYTSPDATGTLRFTPAANSNGVAIITVVLTDNGGTSNGGVNSLTNTFTVTVNAVNDPPTLDTLGNLTVNEDAGEQSVDLTGISAGPANEPGQTITVTATSSDPALVPDPTVIYASPNTTGTLHFTPAPGSNGVATITVVVTDNGTNGVNAVTNTFTVTVNTVNDPPTLDLLSDRTIDEDAGVQTVNLTGISAGAPDEGGQTLTVTATSSNPGLIPDPTVNYTSPNATGTLQFAPAPGSNGVVTITVVVSDNGGTANNGVNAVTNTFTVTVNALTTIWNPDGNLTNTVSDADGPPGTGFEQLRLIGNLDIQATPANPFTIHLVSLDGASPGPAANFDYTNTYNWTIVTTTRGVTGFDPDKFVIDTSQFTNDLGGGVFSVTLSGDSNSVIIVFSPNHAPAAGAASYARAWGTWLRIPIASLIADFTSDTDGDARALVRTGVSTNGALVSIDSTYIFFAPTNNADESFYYVVRDLRNYRPGDTIQAATNWLTVTVTNAVGAAQSISTTDGGGVTVRFAGVPGYAYDVERSADLASWAVVLTTNAPAGGVWSYVDPNPPTPQAYYRIKQH